MAIRVTKESINGVAFSLVCNCASMIIDSGALSGRSKAQAIRYTAAQHKCKFALLTHSEKHEVYNFSPKRGISFARQIEHFIETHADGAVLNAGLLLLLIPLDNKIYFADIEKGLVSNERTLVISAAKKEIEKAQSSAMEIFLADGGKSQAVLNSDDLMSVSSFVISAKGVQDEHKFYFERLLRLMTFRWRLFHRTQAIIPIVILLLGIGATWVVITAYERQRAEQEERARLLALEKMKKNAADYSAATSLRSFLDYYQTARLLGGNGLTKMTWNRHRINLSGHAERYPVSVVALGALERWNLRLNGFDWTLNSTGGTSNDMRQIDVDANMMRPLLYRLKSATNGKAIFKSMRIEGGYEFVDLSLDMSFGISAITDELITLVNNNPIALEHVVCRFEDWKLLECQAAFKAKYRSAL